jgi:hypothetical protein
MIHPQQLLSFSLFGHEVCEGGKLREVRQEIVAFVGQQRTTWFGARRVVGSNFVGLKRVY